MGVTTASFADDEWTLAGSSAVFGSSWDITDTDNNMTLVEGTTYTWTKNNVTLTAGETYKYKVVLNHSWSNENYGTGTSSGGGDKTFTVDESASYNITITFDTSITEGNKLSETLTKAGEAVNATISQVDLRGGFNDWSENDNYKFVEGSEYTYTLTLDLTEATGDQEFKLVINGSEWIGYNALTLDAPTGWVEAANGDGSNFILNHDDTHYLTYTLTATWVENSSATSNWTLKIEGKDAAPKTTYTASFVNGENWENVYAYVWNSNEDIITSAFPGDAISKTGTVTYNGTEYDVYTYSWEGYEAPAYIIFSDGASAETTNKTDDLTFTDGMTNTDKVTLVPVYVAVGGVKDSETEYAFFSGFWSQATQTDVLTETDGVYTKTYTEVTLPVETIEFKVAQKDYLEAELGNGKWYPKSNVELAITEAGIYNVTITFDGTSSVTVSATKVAEAMTVGSTGWATAKAVGILDFSGVSGLKAYTAAVSGTTVTLNEAGAVPAGTAVVLKADEGTYYVPVVAEAEAVSNALTWYDSYTVNDTYRACYGLVYSGGEAKFARLQNGLVVTNKAILEIEPSSARELKIVIAGDVTNGISSMTAEKAAEGVYNLQGQRVNAPVKGLYIVNGKKVIMK